MKILVLYGPNLNLLGWMSRNTGSRLTLDRLNRSLRRKARELAVAAAMAQLPFAPYATCARATAID